MLQFCFCCCFDGFHGFQRSGLSEDGPVRAADLRAAAAAPVLRQLEGKEREQLPGAGPQQEDALPTETPSSRGKTTCWSTQDIQQYYLQKPHDYPCFYNRSEHASIKHSSILLKFSLHSNPSRS